ncbi:cysteine hydrolase [Candidatus Aerophobetes bacterium]|uniref:Cysteine hydrolase n=1 Tax=Aerophobetes bacterium TaxID=2030807 RepID=A0A523UNF7_UNCAE|nr:MAG: cysteine hydrolase [Candidatus Aerophobetes bacterium]
MAKEALLVIDMLRDFVEKGAPLEVPAARVIVPYLQKRIQEARQKGAAVIYICDAHRSDDEEFTKWPSHALQGTRGGEVIEELKPGREDFIVHKRRYSGFLGSDLELLLRELKVEKIYITGILTNICVFFTAAEASMRDYEVVVFANSVVALSENDHQFALDQLRRVLKIQVL